MIEEEILRCDKLIAEFMGAKVTQNPDYMAWEWLMPVLSKIEGMGFITEAHNEKPGGYYHFKITNGRNPSFTGFDLVSRISSTYWAIVAFIEYYNLNIKK
jgi:hypothetical protein